MHLRTNNNRSGVHSLDRTRGGAARSRGNYLPNTSSNRRGDPRFNYNSSSIPYLNKRQGVVDSAMTRHHDHNSIKPVGPVMTIGASGVTNGGAGPTMLSSFDMTAASSKRPSGYDPVRIGGLPIVKH